MKKTKVKKISIILIMLLLVMGISIVINATTFDNPVIIGFEDRTLYEKVKLELDSKGIKKIQLNKDDATIGELEIKLENEDLNSIESLDLQGVSGSQITNLNGIENFSNLQELNLSGNTITNMTTVTQLTQLNTLNMSGNNLSSANSGVLNTISELTSLTTLNMANTQLDNLNAIKNLNKLENLILSSNTINDFSPISGFTNIAKLDISNNSSFVTIGQIVSLSGIKELNISYTGISSLSGIQYLEQLEKLYASNITGLQKDQNRLEALYSVNEAKEPYLKNLKVLDLSSSGIVEVVDSRGNTIQKANQAAIDFDDLAILTTLEELYLEQMGISDLSGITKLTNLKVLDLATNKIDSDDLEDLIIEKNEVVEEENALKATKIELQDNEIIDISVFAKYPADIKYLDLSKNHIYDTSPLEKHSFSEKLYLKQQDITFSIYDKAVDVNHYIILPEIFKSNKIQGSLVYSENEFTTVGLELNRDYTDPNEYNVIIGPEKTKSDTISIKINGGNADGTTLTYVVGLSASSSHNGYVTESLYFNDANLYQTMVNEINNDPQAQGYAKYIGDSFIVVPQKIININRVVIDRMKLLYFDNKSIQDITGLENCSALTDLYLQGNDISTIKPIEACTNIVLLKLANNKNIENNNSAIEKMTKLTYLDLSNTGMTNIDSINNLISSLRTLKLYELNVSQNSLQNIGGIEKITSLGKLGIADNQLDDEDLAVIKDLTRLTTLDISGNQMSNISALSNLSNITYLYFDNNKVESIEPLTGKKFTELSFKENKIKDITPLLAHTSINKLYVDNNQIEDVSVLDNISIGDFSATGQRITRILTENATGDVSIQLPQIFKAAKTSGSKVYTSNDLMFTNCELDTTGENLIVNVNDVNTEAAQLKIYQGKANGTTLTVTIPLSATIEYSIPSGTPTNQNVTATITFNRSNVTITNNDGKNTYTFDKNGEFTFEYMDEYGFEGTATAVVNNIDREPPVATVTQEVKNKQVIVTITVNKKVANIEGWTSTELANGKMQLTKTYSDDANESITLTDEAGNSTPVSIQVKIDKTLPVITGVENGKTYNGTVTPVIQDESEYTVILTKDGTTVTDYKSGDAIKESGQYVLTVTDIFDNTTTVSFEIAISDIITPKENDTITVVEDEATVKDISPKTTVSALKQKLNSEMEYTIVDKDGVQISEKANVRTGCKIKMKNGKMYTLIVKGDCNGDGQADLKDILAINKHRLNKTNLTAEYLKAADVDGNGKPELKDILQINKFRLGKTNEL